MPRKSSVVLIGLAALSGLAVIRLAQIRAIPRGPYPNSIAVVRSVQRAAVWPFDPDHVPPALLELLVPVLPEPIEPEAPDSRPGLARPAATVEPLPWRDVNAYCQSLGPAYVVNICLQDEQRAYDYLKVTWSSLLPYTRQFCLHNMMVAPALMYRYLADCVMHLEYAHRGERPTPAFHE